MLTYFEKCLDSGLMSGAADMTLVQGPSTPDTSQGAGDIGQPWASSTPKKAATKDPKNPTVGGDSTLSKKKKKRATQQLRFADEAPPTPASPAPPPPPASPAKLRKPRTEEQKAAVSTCPGKYTQLIKI